VHALCTGVNPRNQRHFEAKGAGHYGIFSGRRWRDMVYPQVQSFIAAHTPAPKVSVTVAAPKAVAVAKRVATAPVKRATPKAAPVKAPVVAKTTRAASALAPVVGRKAVRTVAPVAAAVAPAAKKKAAAKRAAR